MRALKKIVLMGSPDFALPTLEMLHTHFSGCIQAVFSQPDKPKGRGKHLEPTSVKARALELDLPVFTPLDKHSLQAHVFDLNPDLIIVIAYGMILPKAVTDRFFCLNSHGSILPAYRGASPIQASLLNGDLETGVSLIHMNEKMDEGAVVLNRKLTIEAEDNLGTVTDKLAALSAQACLDFIQTQFIPDHIQEEPQDHTQASYCYKLSSADRELKPEDSLRIKLQKIKAYSPYPGAFLIQDQKRIKILDAKLDQEQLIPIMVQPEGKQPMPYRDFCLGTPKGISL